MNLKTLYIRTIYLGYYLKQMDWPKFRIFIREASRLKKRSSLVIGMDAVAAVYRYNIGLIDYFYFRFFEKSRAERQVWVGTGYKYEYDLKMNPRENRFILQNKLSFFEAYAPFIRHGMCTLKDLEEVNEAARKVLSNSSGKMAVKDALGQCGWNVEILRTDAMSRKQLLTHMKSKGFNMAEEFIAQHPDLNRLSPSGLNTVRIITQLNEAGGVEFIGPTLRVTVNSSVDNMAMGNIAAPIDLATGKISGPGVYQDIIKSPEERHPVTGIALRGFQIPYWQEVLSLCSEAALYNTSNRSIGWDVAITEKGPSFLEGNHNWCKLLWQLPLGEGRKKDLDQYLTKFSSIQDSLKIDV